MLEIIFGITSPIKASVQLLILTCIIANAISIVVVIS